MLEVPRDEAFEASIGKNSKKEAKCNEVGETSTDWVIVAASSQKGAKIEQDTVFTTGYEKSLTYWLRGVGLKGGLIIKIFE